MMILGLLDVNFDDMVIEVKKNLRFFQIGSDHTL